MAASLAMTASRSLSARRLLQDVWKRMKERKLKIFLSWTSIRDQ